MAIRQADFSRYPDPSYTALRRRLATLHGVAPERIVVAGSASEFIMRMTAAATIGQAAGVGAVQVPQHGYGDYARAALAHGLAVQSVSACALPDRADGAALRLAWACDPSSPLGQAEPDLALRLAALPAAVPLVLDCAYAPLRLDGGPPTAGGVLDRVWQLWSPNKALGLTGVRGAYAVAPADEDPQRLRSLLRLAPSWPLGAHAVAMLDCWAADSTQAWLAACLPVLREWKALQTALCGRLGWQTLPSDTNYFCARITPDAKRLSACLAGLRAEGIQLRDCASFGLPGHVRLAVRPPPSQARLAEAWPAAWRATG